MKRAFFALALLIGLLPSATLAQAKKTPPLRASCSRTDALFKIGEWATFLIKSEVNGEATYRFSEDGYKTLDQGQMKLERGKTYSLQARLKQPGFLQLKVEQDGITVLAAAGFEPTKIQPTTKPPDDFDAFWEAGLKELARVPINPQTTYMNELSNQKVNCYKVTLDNIDNKKVYGWLCVPKGREVYPAILTLPGAGVYGIKPDLTHAELGAMSMNIIIHDIPADEGPEFYKTLAAGDLKDYRDQGIEDKHKSYYRAAILGCIRCIDYLVSRHDFDGKDVAVTGGSQGGALTLITCGLDRRVTLAAPNVAAMCDHSGFAHGRIGGWPHWLHRFKGDKAKQAKVLEVSPYYDAVNFARKFKGKSLHGVGFIDTVCAPTTVYAAYNVMPEPKSMITSPLMSHATDPRWLQAREQFWKTHLKLKPPE